MGGRISRSLSRCIGWTLSGSVGRRLSGRIGGRLSRCICRSRRTGISRGLGYRVRGGLGRRFSRGLSRCSGRSIGRCIRDRAAGHLNIIVGRIESKIIDLRGVARGVGFVEIVFHFEIITIHSGKSRLRGGKISCKSSVAKPRRVSRESYRCGRGEKKRGGSRTRVIDIDSRFLKNTQGSAGCAHIQHVTIAKSPISRQEIASHGRPGFKTESARSTPRRRVSRSGIHVRREQII